MVGERGRAGEMGLQVGLSREGGNREGGTGQSNSPISR